MTTSGTNTFNPVRDTIVKAALRMVGAYNSNSAPSADQLVDATEALNIMLKSWQVEGFLWLKRFALLTLTPGQASYLLGPQEDGTPSPDVCVYEGTATQITRPTRIIMANRRNASNYDTPMVPISREGYMMLPTKTAQGSPVQFYYDPQLQQGRLYVWPVPSIAESIYLSCDRGIYDLVADTDTFDVPQEWLRLIKWGLAVEIAPEYALPAGEYANLQAKYEALKESISQYDREPTETQIMIGR